MIWGGPKKEQKKKEKEKERKKEILVNLISPRFFVLFFFFSESLTKVKELSPEICTYNCCMLSENSVHGISEGSLIGL